MTPMQLLFIIISLLILIIMVFQLKRDMLNFKQYLSWSLIWLALLVVTMFIDKFSKLSTFFGVGRFVDLIIYLSIIVLFIYSYSLHIKIEKTNREITKLVRDNAIKGTKGK